MLTFPAKHQVPEGVNKMLIYWKYGSGKCRSRL